jgi:large subunit ribosomal protein L21
MFAVLETGGKQYKVTEGDILEVELLGSDNISKDNKVKFNQILLLENDKDITIGQPYVKDAEIKATVIEQFKDSKVIVFKKKSKKQYKRKRGHRQSLHRIKIETIGIVPGSSAKAAPKAETKVTPKAETKAAPKTVSKTAPKKTAKAPAKTTAKTAAKKPAKATAAKKEPKAAAKKAAPKAAKTAPKKTKAAPKAKE